GAYPEEAQIDIWQRTITLVRGKEVTLRDEYKLKSVTGALSMNLLTTCEPVLSRPGTLELKRAPLVDGRESGSALLHFDATAFDLELELIELDDERMNKAWGARLTRIVFRARKPEIKGNWTFRLTRGV
nr:hypothetical protein [Kiritimatiellia bacterium]